MEREKESIKGLFPRQETAKGRNAQKKRFRLQHLNIFFNSFLFLRNDEDQLSPSSDGELEFLDAASSRSASPPNSYSRAMSQRSPSKVPGEVVIKRKPKSYRSVITDVFDGKLVSSVQCLTCDRVSSTTETFQVSGDYSTVLELSSHFFRVL